MNRYETPAFIRWLPGFIKFRLRWWHRRHVLGQAVATLATLALGAPPTRRLLEDLIYGWGNEGMSAKHEYLAEVIVQAQAMAGGVLECGSGLTTLVLGLTATRLGRSVLALEENGDYARSVRARLSRHGVTSSVDVLDAPLVNHGAFTWYRVPSEVSRGFSLVICDGPSPRCPTGRYGLVPAMRDRLEPGCVILLDDADTPTNRDIVRRWAAELGTAPELFGRENPFAILRVPRP